MLPADQIKRRLQNRFNEARERAKNAEDLPELYRAMGAGTAFVQAYAEVFDLGFAEAYRQMKGEAE